MCSSDLLIILFIKEKKTPTKEEVIVPPIRLSFKVLPANLKLFIIVSSIFTMGHFGYAFLLLKAKNIGFSDTNAIFFYVIFYIIYTICSIPSGILSDKIGRKPVLLTSYMLFAITSLGLIFATSAYSIVSLFAVYGIFYAMMDGVQRAYVVDMAPKNLKATALGAFHTAVGLVALPGGFFAGYLWDKIGPEATFVYGIVLTIIAILLFMTIKEQNKDSQTV